MADWEKHYPYREPGSRPRSEADDDRNGGYAARERRQRWERNPDVSRPREWLPESASEQYPEYGYGTPVFYSRPRGSEWERRPENAMGREASADEWTRQSRGYGYGATARSRRESFGHMGRGPKGYRPSDERIRDQINERLTMHPEVDASEVEVRVENGMVILTGTVEDRHAKRLTEDIAEDVFGVDDVRNELRVRRGFFASLMGDREEETERETVHAGERVTTKTPRTAR